MKTRKIIERPPFYGWHRPNGIQETTNYTWGTIYILPNNAAASDFLKYMRGCPIEADWSIDNAAVQCRFKYAECDLDKLGEVQEKRIYEYKGGAK